MTSELRTYGGLPKPSLTMEVVRRDLKQIVAPEVASQRGQTLLQMIDLVLVDAARRSETDVDCASARSIAADQASSKASAPAGSPAHLIRQAIAAELANLRAEQERDAAQQAWQPDAARAELFAVTPEKLTTYLRKHVPGMEQASVTRIEQVVGGLSKDTFLIDITGVTETGLVLRRDNPDPPIDFSAVAEVPILRSLFDLGLAVPEPLKAEPRADFFGMPFQIARRVSGTALSGAVDWTKLGAEAKANISHLAEFLAQLHRTPVEAVPLGYAAGSDSRDCILGYISAWERWWLRNQMEPSAILTAAFDWLKRNAPAGLPLAIVHGDAGLHNLMIDGDHVTAMIDWELVHIGVAAEDLLYAKNWVAQLMDFDEFLQLYRDAGGPDPHLADNVYFEMLVSIRNVVCTIAQYRAFRDSEYPLLPSAYSGIKWQRHFLIEVGERLARVLK